MDRRAFLTLLAAGTAAALSACESEPASPTGLASSGTAPAAGSPPPPVPTPAAPPALPAPPASSPVPQVVRSIAPMRPGAAEVISEIPGQGSMLALTIDDGEDSAVLGAYLDFVRASGIKLTFFVNGIRPAWTEHRDSITELIETGQVQVANHTWSHPDITAISASALAEEITRNEAFIQDTWGVSGRPFLRPPFGRYSAAANRVAGDLGYTMITMWYGSLGDAALLTEDVLLGEAQKWLLAQRIVIGHANYPTVTHLYGQILDLIRSRALQTVTLSEAFPQAPLAQQ